jgi:hypothetical protein
VVAIVVPPWIAFTVEPGIGVVSSAAVIFPEIVAVCAFALFESNKPRRIADNPRRLVPVKGLFSTLNLQFRSY